MAPTSPALTLSAEQEAVVAAAVDWFEHWGSGDLKIGGYAGTGKTTIVKEIIARLAPKRPIIAAFTGKAANVLRNKGVPSAATIHSTIYRYDEDTHGFELKSPSEIDGDLFIIDEASMVSRELYNDLASFHIPMIFVGDHGQLEPVSADTFNLMDQKGLDHELVHIHRQAHDNPILRFAQFVRMGKKPFYADCRGLLHIMPRGSAPFTDPTVDQILCGFNRTRCELNSKVRRHRGFTGTVAAGEKVVCLLNNRELGIFNGMLGTITAVHDDDEKLITADVTTDDGRRLPRIDMIKAAFGSEMAVPRPRGGSGVTVWDYGYALTVHKAQGSEWDKVLVFEELGKHCDHARWRYTAVTRAAKQLVYCC